VEASERRLVAAWQRGLSGPLQTTDGRMLHIVYRGHCPGGAGPDIRAALIAFDDGILLEGDVEFHRRTSDWFNHSHHHDPHYQSVILHVVLQIDADPPLDRTGRPIPTLVVSLPDPTEPGDALSETLLVEECHRRVRARPAETLGELLDRLGDRRLVEHAARFEAELTRLPPEQLAYQAVFDALGFSRNRSSFVHLAEMVPWSRLVSLVGRRSREDALLIAQAILFGVAGLLPSQRSESTIDWETSSETSELESIWALYRHEWEANRLQAADWIFGGVRPANYPTRRIATAAWLIIRYRSDGLDQALLTTVAKGVVRGRDLTDLFLVDEPIDYWSTHADFGRPLPNGPTALLGRERARDAVINVVLPFALAIAAQRADRALADAAWETYRAYPRPTVYLATRVLAREIGVADHLVRSARRQQGLLYLLRRHCERAACLSCPLGSEEPVLA